MSAIGQQLLLTEEVVAVTVHHHMAAVAAAKATVHHRIHTVANDVQQLNARNAMPTFVFKMVRYEPNVNSYRFHHFQSVPQYFHLLCQVQLASQVP